MGPFDREMVRDDHRERRGSAGRSCCIPGLMYRAVSCRSGSSRRRCGASRTTRDTRPIAARPFPTLAGRLPAEYVAVRFYFSACFPDTAEQSRVRGIHGAVAGGHTDVVLLNTGIRVDDHQDYAPGASAAIHTVDDLMTPERNLDVQTAVIAGARAFVGTYGGYSYLAPLCGVPSLAFYSVRDAFFAHHLELAERVLRQMHGRIARANRRAGRRPGAHGARRRARICMPRGVTQ